MSLIERIVVPPSFLRAFRDVVGHGEDLVGVLVQKQVVIAKVPPAHVPVKILGLDVDRKNVGERFAQSSRDLGDALVAQIGRHFQNGV